MPAHRWIGYVSDRNSGNGGPRPLSVYLWTDQEKALAAGLAPAA